MPWEKTKQNKRRQTLGGVICIISTSPIDVERFYSTREGLQHFFFFKNTNIINARIVPRGPCNYHVTIHQVWTSWRWNKKETRRVSYGQEDKPPFFFSLSLSPVIFLSLTHSPHSFLLVKTRNILFMFCFTFRLFFFKVFPPCLCFFFF